MDEEATNVSKSKDNLKDNLNRACQHVKYLAWQHRTIDNMVSWPAHQQIREVVSTGGYKGVGNVTVKLDE